MSEEAPQPAFIVNKAGKLQKKPSTAKRFKATVRPCVLKDRPHLKWVLNISHPVKGRERHFFRTKEQAESAAIARRTEAENFGLTGLELTSYQRLELVLAHEKLQPFGVSLTQVVDEFTKRRSGSLVTFAEVADKFIESRRHLDRSERYLETLVIKIRPAKREFGERRASDVTGEDLQRWIESQSMGPSSKNHLRTILHSVFEFARRRKIVRDNPAADVERTRVPIEKVGILTPGKMQALLRAAKLEPEVLATIAIGGFAGLRPAEIARLQWNAIDLDHGHIDCAAEITKTAMHRYVKIEPVLRAWLGVAYPALPANGPIQSSNFRRQFDLVRRMAGFDVASELFRLKPDDGGREMATPEELETARAGLPPWPHDALRHSFGSYHLAHFRDAGRTALELGHKRTDMLFQNYRARVTEVTAAAWWNLFPTSEQKPQAQDKL